MCVRLSEVIPFGLIPAISCFKRSQISLWRDRRNMVLLTKVEVVS